MGNLAVGLRQIYGGMKTIFGRGGARKATQVVAQKPIFKGPTITELAERMPLALPAPSAEVIAAAKPRVNVGKALGMNVDELRMSQVITKDGTHVRYFRGPKDDRILIKTADKGINHQEWITPNSDTMTYMHQVGDNQRYIIKKQGNLTQIEQSNIQYCDGINQKVVKNDQYYYNGQISYHRAQKKGFNGTKTDHTDMRGTVEGFTYNENGQRVPVPKKYYAVAEGTRFSARPKNIPTCENSIDDLCSTQGEEIADKAIKQAKCAHKYAVDNFIDDFDEALFGAYKA